MYMVVKPSRKQTKGERVESKALTLDNKVVVLESSGDFEKLRKSDAFEQVLHDFDPDGAARLQQVGLIASIATYGQVVILQPHKDGFIAIPISPVTGAIKRFQGRIVAGPPTNPQPPSVS